MSKAFWRKALMVVCFLSWSLKKRRQTIWDNTDTKRSNRRKMFHTLLGVYNPSSSQGSPASGDFPAVKQEHFVWKSTDYCTKSKAIGIRYLPEIFLCEFSAELCLFLSRSTCCTAGKVVAAEPYFAVRKSTWSRLALICWIFRCRPVCTALDVTKLLRKNKPSLEQDSASQ